MKYILSIDGGGIRGIIPALIISEIEKKTGKQCYELFDLIAGTSTGGILALGLTSGIPAENLVKLYSCDGKRIFNKPWWRKGLFISKYSNRGFKTVLKENFKTDRINGVKSPVLVTAYDATDRVPVIFTRSTNLSIVDAALATASAPCYFPPAVLRLFGRDHTFIDGGLAYNNPSLVARDYIKSLWPNEPTCTISIGTGLHKRAPINNDIESWGLAQWLPYIFEILMETSATEVDRVMMGIPNTPIEDKENDTYLRWQTPIRQVDKSMDDVSESHINSLIESAKKTISKIQPDLAKLSNDLLSK
jgi:patatin-like phospholipase/acyl hydrolase